MVKHVLWSALVAGAAAAVVATLAQSWQLLPLIEQAELFESGHSHGGAGLARLGLTGLTNLLTGVGFALLLAAAICLRGKPVDVRQGLLWGLGGFLAVQVAPALGMPAELPGAAAAPLLERQAWWLGTVAATGIGLALVVFAPRAFWKAAGVVLLALPHAIGAPHPPAGEHGLAPPELAAHFAVASLFMAAVFWATLGGVLGKLLQPAPDLRSEGIA